MIRFLLAVVLIALTVPQMGCARGQGDDQTLVDRATLTVQDLMTQTVSQDPRTLLESSKAVVVCPRMFKAGFFIGGEGGSCVLLARAGNGTWSYPAFYGLGSGSFGFQFGIQDSQLLMLIMTNRGLDALLDSQFKFGANASIAVATVGASVQGATTTAVGADIVAFAASRGLFGGVALEGSILSSRSESNQAYYGQPFSARQIVMQMQAVNPGADPLREVLTRYGASSGPIPATAQPGARLPQAGPGYAPAYPPYQGAPPGYQQPPATPSSGSSRPPVQEQNLTPPAR